MLKWNGYCHELPKIKLFFAQHKIIFRNKTWYANAGRPCVRWNHDWIGSCIWLKNKWNSWLLYLYYSLIKCLLLWLGSHKICVALSYLNGMWNIGIHIHTITCIHSLTLYPCIWRWTLTLTLTLALVTPNPHPRIWLSCRRWRMVEPFLAWSASARCPWMWFVKDSIYIGYLYL